MNSNWFKILMKMTKVKYGKNLLLKGVPVIFNKSGATLKIGDNVGISGTTIYARNRIENGENTCIGGNCKILDNDFHPIEAEARNRLLNDPNGGESELVPSKPIKIGKNCFIGCNSIILKGTVLRDGCVIGAGAVVAGKFENNCMIAGKPGKGHQKAWGGCLMQEKNTYIRPLEYAILTPRKNSFFVC